MAEPATLDGAHQPTSPVALPYPLGVGQRWWEGPGSITYGGVPHLGITFRLLVKEQETFTVAA